MSNVLGKHAVCVNCGKCWLCLWMIGKKEGWVKKRKNTLGSGLGFNISVRAFERNEKC
jgi:hypothetical protein